MEATFLRKLIALGVAFPLFSTLPSCADSGDSNQNGDGTAARAGANTGGTGNSAGNGGTSSGSGGAGDPRNCGEPGRVCAALEAEGGYGCPNDACCSSGECAPALSECIGPSDGFSSCGAYCASIGETCMPEGCLRGERTAVGFDDAAGCESFDITWSTGGGCDFTIPWRATPDDLDTPASVRCCCSDTAGSGGSTGGGGGSGGSGTGGSGTGGSGTGGAAGTGTVGDPMNCGSPGHVCDNQQYQNCPNDACCVDGRCAPAISACVGREFSTCAEACASFGETCAPRGCYRGEITAQGFATREACTAGDNEWADYGECEERLWGAADTAQFAQCCCTDTR